MPEDTYLTVKDISQKLQVSVDTVRRWLRSGELQSVNFGNQYRVSPADLDAFLAKYRKQPPPEKA
ncbi:MAG: helix-turn-helix domain-containing protein [Ktedonobacteraceae bacterium]